MTELQNLEKLLGTGDELTVGRRLRSAWLKLCPPQRPYSIVPVLAGLFCIALESCLALLKATDFPVFGQKAFEIYLALGAIAGSLLGFMIASATIFLSLPIKERLQRAAQEGLLVPVFSCFIHAIKSLGLLVCLTFLGALSDTDAHPLRLFQHICTILSIMATAYCFQAIAIFQLVSKAVLDGLEKQMKDELDSKRQLERGRLGPEDEL